MARGLKKVKEQRPDTHLGGRGGRTCGTAAKLPRVTGPVVGAGAVTFVVVDAVVVCWAGCPYEKPARCGCLLLALVMVVLPPLVPVFKGAAWEERVDTIGPSCLGCC